METMDLNEIRKYLSGKYAHLAGALDSVPEEYLEALYNMVGDLEAGRVQHPVISMQVGEDVAALVAGFEDGAKFCKGYL